MYGTNGKVLIPLSTSTPRAPPEVGRLGDAMSNLHRSLDSHFQVFEEQVEAFGDSNGSLNCLRL